MPTPKKHINWQHNKILKITVTLFIISWFTYGITILAGPRSDNKVITIGNSLLPYILLLSFIIYIFAFIKNRKDLDTADIILLVLFLGQSSFLILAILVLLIFGSSFS